MAKKRAMMKREARAVWADPQCYGIATACYTGGRLYCIVFLFKRRTVIWII
jgi:hypothetical protein